MQLTKNGKGVRSFGGMILLFMIISITSLGVHCSKTISILPSDYALYDHTNTDFVPEGFVMISRVNYDQLQMDLFSLEKALLECKD